MFHVPTLIRGAVPLPTLRLHGGRQRANVDGQGAHDADGDDERDARCRDGFLASGRAVDPVLHEKLPFVMVVATLCVNSRQ